MSHPPLTLLYTGADRESRLEAAWQSSADVALFDLEDAVAASAKEAARSALTRFFAQARNERSVQVRINHVSTPWHDADIALITTLPAFVEVRVPKVESATDVVALAERLPGRRLHLLLESALGIERAYEIAVASPAVASLGLGEADLRGDLRVDGDDGLLYARTRVVVAARAAGLPAPHMSVFANTRDADALAASCAAGKALGFRGRAAIHPAQLAVIDTAFRPSDAEVERARLVLDRIATATAAGTGALALDDGTFLDVAMIERARETVALANKWGVRS